MGLNEKGKSGGGNFIFLSPINVDGQGTRWARRVSADTEGAVERDAKCGLVHELYYETVDGMIEAVRIVDKGDYGEQLEVALRDGDTSMILSTPFAGDIGKGFICRMEHVDETLNSEIGVFNKVINGNDRRYCYMIQNGQKVPHDYTKDGSKSLPEPIKEEKARGKVEWNWEDHENALYDICQSESIAKGWAKDEAEFATSFFKHEEEEKEETPAAPEEPPTPELDEDDVPF